MTTSKTFNRLLSVLLLVCMMVSFAPAAYAEGTETPASVEEPAVAETAVAEAAAKPLPTAIVPGDGTVEPQAPSGSVKCNFYSNPPAEGLGEEQVLTNQTVTFGDLSLFAGKFAYDGYKQTGWNTARDGSGDAYALNGTITKAATLYAQWEVDESEPTFDKKPNQPTSALAGSARIWLYSKYNPTSSTSPESKDATIGLASNLSIGEVQGNDNVGYWCDITVTLAHGDGLETALGSYLNSKNGTEENWTYNFEKTGTQITFTIYNLLGTNKWWGSKSAISATNSSSTDLKSSCASNIKIYMDAPELYTVTYTDGVDDEVVFEDVTFTVAEGEATPAFGGTPARENWVFTGWDPEVAETVTGDVTYTAQWEKGTANKPAASKSLTDADVKKMAIRAYAVGPVNTAGEMYSCVPSIKAAGLSKWEIGAIEGNDVDGYTQTVTFYFVSGDAFEAAASAVFDTYKNYANVPELRGNWVYDFDYEAFDAVQSVTFHWVITKSLITGKETGSWKLPSTVGEGYASNITTAVANHIKAYLYLPEYTVTYTDGVDGEELFADQVYTQKSGRATPAFEGEPTREGYTFTGWDPQVAETVSGDATYTATWTADEYTVTFNSNGGNDLSDKSLAVTYGEKYGELYDAGDVDGFTSEGWYLNDTAITADSVVTTASDHELFQKRAIAEPTVEMTYDRLTSTWNIPYSGKTVTLTANVTEYPNLVYSYQWYKDGEAIEGATGKELVLDGNVVDSGTYKVVVTVVNAEGSAIVTTNESASASAEKTLTITKAKNALTVYRNDGTNKIYMNAVTVNSSIVLELQAISTMIPSTFAWEGHTFLDLWTTNPDGTGDVYKTGDTYTFDDHNGNGGDRAVLYLQWALNEYTIPVDPANGEEPYELTFTYENRVGDELRVHVREGYTFTGWVDQDGNPVDLNATYTEAIEKLVGTWKPNEYVVPVDPANGEDAVDVTYTYEDVIGDKYDFETEPVRKGYTFEGWVDQDGNPVDLTATYTEDIESISASWKGKTYTVTFKLNEDEGTLSFTSKKVVYGDPIGATPVATREGNWAFIGWYDANGKYYDANSIYDVDGDLTLTGRWIVPIVPTGDDSHPALFALLMFASLACAGATVLRLRKGKEET